MSRFTRFFCESCLCKTFEKIHVYSEGSQSSFSFEGHIIQVLLTTQKQGTFGTVSDKEKAKEFPQKKSKAMQNQI